MCFPVQNFGNFIDSYYYFIGNYYYYHIPEFLYILYTESGPVRATGVWSCAHRREIYYYERISTESGPVWATGVWSCAHRHETPAWSDFSGKHIGRQS